MVGHERVIRALSPLYHGQVHVISVCKTLQLQMTQVIQTRLASYHPHQRKCRAGVPKLITIYSKIRLILARVSLKVLDRLQITETIVCESY